MFVLLPTTNFNGFSGKYCINCLASIEKHTTYRILAPLYYISIYTSIFVNMPTWKALF